MGTQQIILLVINILGELPLSGAIISASEANQADEYSLGRSPASIRPVYTVSMILSALGYFAFIYFILFRLVPMK